MRCPLVIGNWKLNGNKKMVSKLIASIVNKLSNVSDCNVAIAPPVIYLDLAKQQLADSCITLGAQNVDSNTSGAFTGEISANMLKDIGVKYVIIGHSERRSYHKETYEQIAKKFIALKDTGLTPVLCIGESKEENNRGQTEEVCARQLRSILNTNSARAIVAKTFDNVVIAYEPIWAIGTGKSANIDQIKSVVSFIRRYIAGYDEFIAEKLIIQYGGSVTPSNAAELFNQSDIDGALVGNASLNAESFACIVKAAAVAKASYIK